MAKSKKSPSKPKVQVRDMKAKKNPKGGASDIFAKIAPSPTTTPTLGSINFDVNSLNFKK